MSVATCNFREDKMRCNYVLCRTVLSIPISEVRMVYSCNSLTEGTVLHMIKNPQHRIA